MMAFIFGTFMAIGGVVLCFAGKLELGIALYAIASLCMIATDICTAIEKFSPKYRAEGIHNMIDGLKTMTDILGKLDDDEK